MVNKKIDTTKKTIVLDTSYEFKDFEITKYIEHFHFNFTKNKNESMGCSLNFNKFKGKKNYPKEIEIVNVDIENKTVELKYT